MSLKNAAATPMPVCHCPLRSSCCNYGLRSGSPESFIYGGSGEDHNPCVNGGDRSGQLPDALHMDLQDVVDVTIAYNNPSNCDYFSQACRNCEQTSAARLIRILNSVNLYIYLFVSRITCLLSRRFKCKAYLTFVLSVSLTISPCSAFANEFEKAEKYLDDSKINLDQIAAVFNKVAYGSTTKRSIPDSVYPLTTLATPLLTTYRYSGDGGEEWLRVDLKKAAEEELETGRGNSDTDADDVGQGANFRYGSDLEKDHGLPTSAPAADILKNNNNKNYNNPNR